MNQASPIRHFWMAFVYAWAGVRVLFRTQRSFRIHAGLSLVVVAAAFLLRVPVLSWCWLILAISAVLSAEAMNTAVEFLANVVSPQFHPDIKKVKDVAAAAVFFAAAGAAVIVALVLGPPLWALLAGTAPGPGSHPP